MAEEVNEYINILLHPLPLTTLFEPLMNQVFNFHIESPLPGVGSCNICLLFYPLVKCTTFSPALKRRTIMLILVLCIWSVAPPGHWKLCVSSAALFPWKHSIFLTPRLLSPTPPTHCDLPMPSPPSSVSDAGIESELQTFWSRHVEDRGPTNPC